MKHNLPIHVESLYPGYFAAVMATGILSVVTDLEQWQIVSAVLFWLAVLMHVSIFALNIIRIAFFPESVKRDLFQPLRVFGYFTFVAGTNVLATRLGLANHVWTMIVLACVGFCAWCCLLYFIFAMLLFANERHIEKSVNGSWLIATVATQSVSIVSAGIAVHLRVLREQMLFVSYVFWSFGILLYLIFIVLIVYRFFFRAVRPEDLTPPYWINMGAMAITAVAGARLAVTGGQTQFLTVVHPFVVAFSVTMWTWGTWWIPLLLIMGIWKYRVFGDFRAYDPSLWSIIFPLGMYATSLDGMSDLPGLSFLHRFVTGFMILALICWFLVAAGWLVTLYQRIHRTEGART